jgi:ParB-like chromosome segregation protein Spo0J
MISPADLIPYARNAKKHDEQQVLQIAGSIREFGFNNPVLIDQSNGIIAGHGRVMAAIKLGLESIPVIRLTHLTDIQRRAYILADNKLSELGGGWDDEMLKVELEAVKESDLDHLLTGFSEEDFAKLLSEDTTDSPADFESYDESIETEHQCPKCGYRWSGGSGGSEPAE